MSPLKYSLKALFSFWENLIGDIFECSYTGERTDMYGVYVHSYGRGRTITVPFKPGLIYHRKGFDNLYLYMHDLLVSCAHAETVEAKPFTEMVEVTLGESEDGSRMMVHLVNTSGHFGRSFMKPLPVYDIALKLPVPAEPQSVTCMTVSPEPEMTEQPFEYRGGTLYITVKNRKSLPACLSVSDSLHLTGII
ncbi:MAG: hypothetical protein K6D03_08135 [Solobacterium sp.]|nr:hypothetical protein [Solobacterium sp.]